MASASRVKEVSFAGFMSLLSLALFARGLMYPAESSQFPRFMMILQSAFSLVLLYTALRLPGSPSASGAAGAGKAAAVWKELKAPLQVFLSASLYIFGIGFLGYFTATILFLAISMFVFGRHKAVVIIGASLGFIAVIYALFVLFIGVRLPQGFLG